MTRSDRPTTIIMCGVKGRPRGKGCLIVTTMTCPDCGDIVDMTDMGTAAAHQCSLPTGARHH